MILRHCPFTLIFVNYILCERDRISFHYINQCVTTYVFFRRRISTLKPSRPRAAKWRLCDAISSRFVHREGRRQAEGEWFSRNGRGVRSAGRRSPKGVRFSVVFRSRILTIAAALAPAKWRPGRRRHHASFTVTDAANPRALRPKRRRPSWRAQGPVAGFPHPYCRDRRPRASPSGEAATLPSCRRRGRGIWRGPPTRRHFP